MGGAGRNKTVLMEFAIIKCRSLYNVIIGRTRMRRLEAVGSTILSMIKFPTDQGIVTMETCKEALWECRQLEKMQSLWKERQWRQHTKQMSRIRKQTILRARNNPGHRLGKEPILPKKVRDEENMGEKVTICSKRPDQCITIVRSEGTAVQRVQHPEWVTNATLIKLASGAWQVQMDYLSLNRICAKDMYPFPKVEDGLASLMGYTYKCFLRLPKENSQIRTVEDNEEKTGFHTEEGVNCFTHMPKGLKNSVATLQRMIEKVLTDQIS
ncbi:reverse transcriptase domain-containing protein [Tanacetum coccineum]